jgi:hypothetical protein
MARCQSWSEADPPLAVLGNQRDANTFQPVRKLPGLTHVSNVIAPAVRAVPAGNTAASPVPSIDMLAPVESLTRAAFPKNVDVAIDEAGLTLFQPVAPEVARDEVLLASRLSTRLFVTIAAAAGGGGSSATSEEVVRANSAINAASLRPPRVTLLYSVANI